MWIRPSPFHWRRPPQILEDPHAAVNLNLLGRPRYQPAHHPTTSLRASLDRGTSGLNLQILRWSVRLVGLR
jgi:hypothetical protein